VFRVVAVADDTTASGSVEVTSAITQIVEGVASGNAPLAVALRDELEAVTKRDTTGNEAEGLIFDQASAGVERAVEVIRAKARDDWDRDGEPVPALFSSSNMT
jgi:hypothetical protein